MELFADACPGYFDGQRLNGCLCYIECITSYEGEVVRAYVVIEVSPMLFVYRNVPACRILLFSVERSDGEVGRFRDRLSWSLKAMDRDISCVLAGNMVEVHVGQKLLPASSTYADADQTEVGLSERT